MTDFSVPTDQLLTLEEAYLVDAALLTTLEKFTTRVAIYALRSLQQISQERGDDITSLTDAEIIAWLNQQPVLQQDPEISGEFQQFYTQLVISSLRPLRQIAQAANQPIAQITAQQIIHWFEQESKKRLDR